MTEERPSVLLVEDQEALRSGLQALLSRRYAVLAAADAEEALALLDGGADPGVVVSDQDLPGRNGEDLLRHLAQRRPEIARVMLTGVADREVAVRLLHEGTVFRFLTKPCGYDELCAAVDEALAHSAEEIGRERERNELRFSRDSLLELHADLERRVLGQTDCLRRLHAFAVELNRSRSLQDVVQYAAQTLHGALGGRGVVVQVWHDDAVGVECALGPEMSADMRVVRLESQDGVVGEITVDRFDPFGVPLADLDVDFLVSVASSTSVAVHNEIRRMERDEAQHATIVALARLSEQRDDETGKHLDRVGLYCEILARGLRAQAGEASGIDERFVEDLVRSAPLHDIGKVGIPDSILLKPGKLTPSEWEVMKTHAELGAKTLDSVIREGKSQGFLEMGRDIAWCHHEKWDGSGYPRGLAGDSIPLAARILALADVYDALTTERPYKRAWTHAEAVDYVREKAGSQFDPRLAEVLAKHAAAFDEVRARYADDPEGSNESLGPRLVRTA